MSTTIIGWERDDQHLQVWWRFPGDCHTWETVGECDTWKVVEGGNESKRNPYLFHYIGKERLDVQLDMHVTHIMSCGQKMT